MDRHHHLMASRREPSSGSEEMSTWELGSEGTLALGA